MKHVVYILTLLLVGVLLVGTGSANAAARLKPKAKAKAPSNVERDQSFVNSPARANLSTGIRKMLANDDPTPTDTRQINGGVPYTHFSGTPTVAMHKGALPFSGPLSGSYNVGAGGAFTTIGDAIGALNALGVSGPVTLVLTDATYNENPCVVGNISGASAVNTVTLEPGVGVAAVVKFTLFTDLPWGVLFSNAHYFTIDGINAGGSSLKLSVDETTTPFPLHPREATIGLGNVTDHITIQNTTITSAADNAVWNNVKDARHGIVLLNTDLSTLITDVNINHNKFGRCFYGVLSICPNDGDDGTIFNGGATGTTFGQVEALVQRLKINDNLFGTAVTGEQPCANAISVGGYGLTYIIGGTDIEVGRNKSVGDQFNGDFDYVDAGAHLIGTYTGHFEPLYHGGLFGPTDIAVHGAHPSLSDSSTVHDNVDSLYYVAKSLTYGTSTASANLAYCFSVRGSTSSSATVYNNLATRAHDNDGGRQTYLIRSEGDRLYHNTFWATGPGRRYFAARVRGGCTYENNIFYAAKNGNTVNRVCALRYDGGSGSHNDIAFDPNVAPGSAGVVLFRDAGGNLYWNLSDLQILSGGSDVTSSQAAPNITDPGHMVPSGTSGAESFGAPIPGFSFNDIANNPRSVSTPDAGAYEFSGVAATVTEAAVIGFKAPPSAGTPVGTPVAPKVEVSNLSTASQNISVTLQIADGSGYSHTVIPTVPALHETTVTFPAWTPPGNGPYDMTASIFLAGDLNQTNDTLTTSQAIVPLLTVVNNVPQVFDFESGAQGWVGTGSWILDDAADDFGSGNLAALGGPHDGGTSWVTDDLTGGGTYAVQTNHQLLSPFFNTNGVESLYVNFFHSIQTEPNWDRSVFEYSIDSGKSWNVIGALNDPTGINWYSLNPYQNAAGDAGCFDNATAGTVQWPDSNGGNAPFTHPAWTSNGDCHGNDLATGPNGWIFVQIKLPAAVIHQPFVRFRYAAFSDGSSTANGWAVDNVEFSNLPNTKKGQFSGKVYADGNANGSHDGYETYTDGIKVYISGGATDSVTTSGGGNFSFGNLTAGAYTISVGHAVGTSVTQPYGPNTYSALFGPGDTLHGDFGLFTGGVSGDPYADNNDNGQKDAGEPGVAGWEVRAYNQSDLYAFKQATAKGDAATLSGLMVASTHTDANGNYFLETKAGDYVIAEVLDPAWKSTQPKPIAGPNPVDTTLINNGDGTFTVHHVYGFYSGVHVDSISNSPNGGRFGNFKYGYLKIYNVLDVNGNGVHEPVENLAMPLGVFSTFSITKNGLPFTSVVVGGNQDAVTVGQLEPGSYTITFDSTNHGWYQTVAGGGTFNVFTGGVTDTIYFGNFQGVTIDGKVYDDKNGDGLPAGDPGVMGWTVNMTGPGGPYSTLTDANGNYAFTNIPAGTYTVSEVVPAGWMRTAPGGPGNITVVVNITGQNKHNNNFGNFKLVTISGVKYRDRNMNGSRDAGDEGLQGWTINCTGQTPATTDANGNYAFTLGPGIYSTTEVSQVGWAEITPISGVYVDTVVSGVNLTHNFGNFWVGDSVKFRTWTMGELAGDAALKLVKKPKPGKAASGPVNAHNLVNDILDPAGKNGAITVGLAGQLVGGKEKGSLKPAKEKDVFKTLNDKGTMHNGNPHPLSFDNSGLKRILKLNKSLTPLKYNNILLADLLTLKINLAASSLHQTNLVGYLGDLLYCENTNPVGAAHMAVADLADSLDVIMTNWDVDGFPGFEGPIYVMYDSIVAKINAAFSTGLTSDTASYGGWSTPKLRWTLKATAQSTSFLCAPAVGGVQHASPFVGKRDPVVNPTVYKLYNNYPNPFNPTTTLSFDLPHDAVVTLKIYNMLGQEVATLFNNESMSAGNQEADFDASQLASGVYFYRIAAKSVNDDGIFTGQTFSQVKKMMLVK